MLAPAGNNNGIVRQHIPDNADSVVAGDGIVAFGSCGPDWGDWPTATDTLMALPLFEIVLACHSCGMTQLGQVPADI